MHIFNIWFLYSYRPLELGYFLFFLYWLKFFHCPWRCFLATRLFNFLEDSSLASWHLMIGHFSSLGCPLSSLSFFSAFLGAFLLYLWNLIVVLSSVTTTRMPRQTPLSLIYNIKSSLDHNTSDLSFDHQNLEKYNGLPFYQTFFIDD